MSSVMHTDLGDYLPLVTTGKVREIYKFSDSNLLFVSTDRISGTRPESAPIEPILTSISVRCGDEKCMTIKKYVQLVGIESDRRLIPARRGQGIDQKGAILTQLSEFWFILLQSRIPGLQTHYVSTGLPLALQQRLPPALTSQLQRRSMVVKRLRMFPIESIVRGYITGSAWNSYQKDGTVCGIKLGANLRESEKLPEPLWTPSTKAELGDKDENISPTQGTHCSFVPTCFFPTRDFQ